MQPMTPQRQAEARLMVSSDERRKIEMLAYEVEQLVKSRLNLGLSGEQVGAIAATVRTELRNHIDIAIYNQRSTSYPGIPTL